jgi:molybdopterin molybdotransferase
VVVASRPFHCGIARGGLSAGYDSCMSPAGVVSFVVTFEEARHIVEQHAAMVCASEVESVDLLAARGRILAEAILADRDFPPFPRATRDGYAVRAADVQGVPARLAVVGEIRAGSSLEAIGGSITVNRGEAASIMTGAPLPVGADAVVMVEYTAEIPHPNAAKSAALGWGTLSSGTAGEQNLLPGRFVEIQHRVDSGENFVPRGAEARAGQLLVNKGLRLDHALIGIAAAVGKGHVTVFRKPRVAVLSTGDELVGIDATPRAAQIRNSNSYSLAAQIEEAGGEAVRLPIAPDEPVRLRALIEEGLSCDLLLLTGGVSMGKYDLVEQVVADLGAEFYFTGAKIQPGKPIVFGSCGAGARVLAADQQSARTRVSAPHYFLGLPGNPVSTMVTFRLFAQPMIEAMAGAKPEPLIFLKARLKSDVRTKIGLTRFLPALISGEFENAEVELAAWQGSGDIAALARANCSLVIPPDRERIEAGELVSVLMS